MTITRLRLLLPFALLTLLATPAQALRGRPVLRVNHLDASKPPMVRVYLSDLDSSGTPITDRNPQHYGLYVDGAQQAGPAKVRKFTEASEPVALTLVIQVSPPLRETFTEAVDGARRLFEGLPAGSSAGLIAYTDVVVKNLKPSAVDKAKEALDSLRIHEDALEVNLPDAIRDALQGLSGPGLPKARMVAVLSDGLTAELKFSVFSDLGRRARDKGIIVHSVGFATLEPTKLRTLKELSERGGGTFREAREPKDVTRAFAALQAEIANQMVLTYKVPGKFFDGKFHQFQIETPGARDVSNEMNVELPKAKAKAKTPWYKASWFIITTVVVLLVIAQGVFVFLWLRRRARIRALAQQDDYYEEDEEDEEEDEEEEEEEEEEAAVGAGGTALAPQQPAPAQPAASPAPPQPAQPVVAPEPVQPAQPVVAPRPAQPAQPAQPAIAPAQPAQPALAPPPQAPAVQPATPVQAPLPAQQPLQAQPGQRPDEFSQLDTLEDIPPPGQTPAPQSSKLALPDPREFMERMSVRQPAAQPLSPQQPLQPPSPAPAGPAPEGPHPGRFIDRQTTAMAIEEIEGTTYTAWICVIGQGGLFNTVVLQNQLVLGADPSCDVPLQGEGILPRHATITKQRDQFKLVFLGPQGEEAASNPLIDDDNFRIGSHELVFKLAPRFPSVAGGETRLEVLDGMDRGRCIPLQEKGVFTVGSHNSCDLVIRGTKVDKRHALVLLEGRTCVISDLGSEAGIWHRGEQVGYKKLHSGDEVTLGNVRLMFAIED